MLAVTANFPTYPASERQAADDLARLLGAQQRHITTDELEDSNFADNPPERCYYCERHLFADLIRIAQETEMRYIVYGATLDDLGDHCPGMQAARELGYTYITVDLEGFRSSSMNAVLALPNTPQTNP